MKYLLIPETTLVGKIKNVATGFLFILLWCFFIQCIASFIFKTAQIPLFTSPQYAHPLIQEFFLSCVLAPLWEEAAFRVAPLLIVRRAGSQYIFPMMIASSAWFGWMHGGSWNILLQGVTGFIFAAVYIKNGFSYKSSVALHFLWNFFLTCMVPVIH